MNKNRSMVLGLCVLLINSVFIPIICGMNVKTSIDKNHINELNRAKTWKRIIGGNNVDYGSDLIQISDDGYIIVGNTYSYDIVEGDGWIIKIDENGNNIWNRTYGDETFDLFSSVYQTTDSGFILTGQTSNKCWLLKTDANGNEIWNRTYKGLGFAYGSSVIQTTEGGFFVCGSTEPSDHQINDSVFLLRVDEFGNEIWNLTFGENDENGASSCIQTLDGGFIITGALYNDNFGCLDAFLLKIDSKGREEWFSSFNSDSDDFMAGGDVVQNSDGSFVIVGIFDKQTYGWFKGYMLKTDSFGNELWRRKYSNFLTFKTVYSISHTEDGGYIIAGEICNLIKFDYDLWLAKTDKYGNLKWSRKFGERGENYLDTIDAFGKALQSKDGGYIILGHTNSYGVDRGDWDILLIKTDSNGFLTRARLSSHSIFLRFLDFFPILKTIFNIPNQSSNMI